MSTKSKYVAGVLVYFDDKTQEIVGSQAPLFFEDEFVGAGHNAGVPAAASPVAGYPWVKKIVGAAPPTVAIVANAGCGVMACALTATSEKQDAALYMNDNLGFDATKALVFEARVNLSVLPSVAGVQMVWGMSSAWIDGPDNASFYCGFGVSGSGQVVMRSKDGVNTFATSCGASGLVVAGDWHIYRMDMTDPTNVRFFIDGVEVSVTNGITFAATGANAIMQSYSSAYKPSGTGVGTIQQDVLKIWTNRV